MLSILPQAHAYGLGSVMDDCMAASASFSYTCGAGNDAAAGVLAFMEMAERLQVREPLLTCKQLEQRSLRASSPVLQQLT